MKVSKLIGNWNQEFIIQDVGKAQKKGATNPTWNMIKGKKSTRDQKRSVCSSKTKCLEIQKLVIEVMAHKLI